ncbi:peroxiredoxin [Enterobacter roggenkampii]|nr:peroxiredoxin [Enterobacter roggenkampii]
MLAYENAAKGQGAQAFYGRKRKWCNGGCGSVKNAYAMSAFIENYAMKVLFR